MSDLDKPTEEQIKEFWEWCGKRKRPHLGQLKTMSAKELSDLQARYDRALLPIDLNNLFKYAVPKLLETINEGRAIMLLGIDWIRAVIIKRQDPALALFWAIWQVKKEAEDGQKRAD